MEGGDYFTKTITALPSNGAFMYVHTKVYHQSESRADFFFVCLFFYKHFVFLLKLHDHNKKFTHMNKKQLVSQSVDL